MLLLLFVYPLQRETMNNVPVIMDSDVALMLTMRNSFSTRNDSAIGLLLFYLDIANWHHVERGSGMLLADTGSGVSQVVVIGPN